MFVYVCVCVCARARDRTRNQQNIVQLDMTKKSLKYGKSNFCTDNENTL